MRWSTPIAAHAAAALLGGLLLLSGACSDDGSSPAPAPTPTTTAEATGIEELERFHYIASLTLRSPGADGVANELTITTEGDFQAPDRHAFTYTTQLGSAAIRESAVVIGDRIWLRTGDEPWREATPQEPQAAELLSAAFSPIRPGFLGGPEFASVRAAVQRLRSTLEFINEVRASHYEVGAEGREYFQAFLANEQFLQDVQDPRWEVWLAEDGAWPVRLLASGTVTAELEILRQLKLAPPTTWELRIDVSRPNDPALAVQAPQ
jgi:hypothetical protein